MFAAPRIVIIALLLFLAACVPVKQEAASNKKQADVHYKLAMAHLQGNNPTMALKELLVAIKQDPENSNIVVALAQTYQRKKAYLLAETAYLKALQLSDNDPQYQNNLASLYLDMKQWDKAIHYFDLASKNLLFVNAHVAVAGKAYAYYKKMDYTQAQKYVDEAIALAPNYASAYTLRSKIYHALGDTEQELYSLRRAIDISPQSLQARYDLAVLLLQENSLKLAADQLKIIYEYAPSTELGRKSKDLLKSLSVD
jgi:Tfp pilus assembly protein PilF